MSFMELAKERYSCRSFDAREVEKDKIDQLLEIIRLSPTARNIQPLHIWVIQAPENLEKIKQTTKYHYNAPLTIAIGYDPKEAWIRTFDNQNHGIVDASIALSNLWMEAAELGLGCVCVSDFDPAKLAELFPEMDGYEIAALMQTGYPSANAKPAKWHTDSKEIAEMVSYL